MKTACQVITLCCTFLSPNQPNRRKPVQIKTIINWKHKKKLTSPRASWAPRHSSCASNPKSSDPSPVTLRSPGFRTREPYLLERNEKKIRTRSDSTLDLLSCVGWIGKLPSALTAAKTSSLRRTFSMSWTSGWVSRKRLWASTRWGCWVPSCPSITRDSAS